MTCVVVLYILVTWFFSNILLQSNSKTNVEQNDWLKSKNVKVYVFLGQKFVSIKTHIRYN